MRRSGESGQVVWVGLHDLSRTGVPIVLLRLLQASTVLERSRIHVVAIHGGPLREDLTSLAGSVTVLEPSGRRSVSGAVVAGLRSVAPGSNGPDSWSDALESGLWRARLSLMARLPRPEVLVVHGAGAWPLVGAVSASTRVVLHLHELGTALDRSIPRRDQPAALARASRIMAVSKPVADLARARGAASEKIVVVPGIVDLAGGAPEDVVPVLDPERSWVVGMGSPGWRKGTDRLAPLAHELARTAPAASVAWVGGRPEGQNAGWVEGSDPVMWVGECVDPWRYVPEGAVVLVPSREDPLPLVALEAGQRGHAVVAMPAGGLTQLLADGRGVLTEHQSLAELRDAIELVLCNTELARELGAALSDHVRTHHTGAVIAPLWWEVINGVGPRWV